MTDENAGRERLTVDDLLQRVARYNAMPGTPDAELMAACTAACEVERRKLALFTGPSAVANDADRDVLLARLDAQADPYLDRAARLAPITWSGHAMRAAAFLAWDAGRVHAEAALGHAGDRVLLAVLHDLALS